PRTLPGGQRVTSVKNSDIHWLGKVASDWEIAPAWRVMKERGEKSLPDDVHLTPSQTHGVLTQQDYMDRTGNKVVLNLAGTDNMKRVRAGDFIIHLRSFQGGIEASAIDGKVSNAYTVLTPAPDAHFGYYRWFMKSVPLIEGLASSTDQLRDGQSINFSRFSRLSLPFPPLETQRRIADYLDRDTAEIDSAVADLDKYVELLETRRQLHIDQTFSALLENWPRAPLGLFFSILNGDRGVNYPKAEEITQAGIPFINAGDVTERRVSLSQAKFVSEEKYESMGGAKLRQGDILFCLRGSLGKHGLVDFDGGSVASSLCVLRPKNANTYRSRFLNLYLDSKFIESEVRFSENGSAQPNLSADSLSRFKVPAVSTEQQ